MRKIFCYASSLFFMIVMLVGNVTADPIVYSDTYPADGTPTNTFNFVASGTETNQSAINPIIAPFLTAADAENIYYNDWDVETGPFANSYDIETEYVDGLNNAVISFENAPAIAEADYLLIKDGKNGASGVAWYLFDISAWNGTDYIYIENFFPGKEGAFSHMTIYGGESFETPEPGSLLLLGTGLFGLALAAWRRKA